MSDFLLDAADCDTDECDTALRDDWFDDDLDDLLDPDPYDDFDWCWYAGGARRVDTIHVPGGVL